MLKTVAMLMYAVAALVGIVGLIVITLFFVIETAQLAIAGELTSAGAYAFASVGSAHVTTLLVDSAHRASKEFLSKTE
jgi:1-deoxy-D-xylulose 5-phosphate reductoisomerase